MPYYILNEKQYEYNYSDIYENYLTFYSEMSQHTVDFNTVVKMNKDDTIITIKYFNYDDKVSQHRYNSLTICHNLICHNLIHTKINTYLDQQDFIKYPLFIINPVSGKGKALDIFNNSVKPILDDLNLSYSVEVTKTQNDIDSIIEKHKNRINNYDCIVAVGGDGTFNELLQVNMMHNYDIPLGIIPTGSGNGLVRSVTHKEYNISILGSLYALLKGKVHKMDMMKCLLKDKTNPPIYSFLSQAWGMPSDVDIESESMRWLGDLRFTIEALFKICKFKHYDATLSYIPVTTENRHNLHKYQSYTWNNNIDEDFGWITIDDKFLMVWICNLPYMTSDMKVSPYSKLDDGLMHLIMIKDGCSRFDVLQMFMQLETGAHVNNTAVSIIPILGYRLYPKNSYLTIDGERVDNVPIQTIIYPSSIKLIK